MGPRPHWLAGAPALAAAAWIASNNFSTSHNWSVVTRSGDSASRSWQIHDYANAVAAPRGTTFLVVPNNSSFWNGPEDLIALGLSAPGIPGAAIAEHSPYRRIRYVANAAEARPGDVIMRPTKRELNGAVPASEPPCRSWDAGYSGQLSVQVCPVVADPG
jgi:hypothetical protein